MGCRHQDRLFRGSGEEGGAAAVPAVVAAGPDGAHPGVAVGGAGNLGGGAQQSRSRPFGDIRRGRSRGGQYTWTGYLQKLIVQKM